MNIEEQTAKIFDTPEKWEAYLDLVSHKERIIQMWNNRLSEKIKQHYSNEDSQEWGFHVEDNNDFRWYLKEFGYNSLLLCFEISKNYETN